MIGERDFADTSFVLVNPRHAVGEIQAEAGALLRGARRVEFVVEQGLGETGPIVAYAQYQIIAVLCRAQCLLATRRLQSSQPRSSPATVLPSRR